MNKKTVVISDIHIGTNDTTNWYHKEMHEPYLAHILQEIINQPDEYEQLVILGDLFDFWTCTPEDTPPTTDEIIAANPNILGVGGLLSQVLEKLRGNVYYVRGNHDITTTEDDLKKIKSKDGKYHVQFPPPLKHPEQGPILDHRDVYVKDGVVYTHGHLFTMFNAPDLSGKQIPMGHFVTRAISYYLKNVKKRPAFDQKGFGVPHMGFGALEKFADDFLGNVKAILKGEITTELFKSIEGETKIPDNETIHLKVNLHGSHEPGGKEISWQEAKVVYENLWNDWVKHYDLWLEHPEIKQDGFGLGLGPDISRGDLFAYKAAMADYDGSYLGWFALQLAFQYNANLVVMGHTHTPKMGLDAKLAYYNRNIAPHAPTSTYRPIVKNDEIFVRKNHLSPQTSYINCGFECVPGPDEQDKQASMTYSVITTAHGTLIDSEVREVRNNNGSYQSDPIKPGEGNVHGEAADDYSCYVEVLNCSDDDYVLDPRGVKAQHGYFVVFPPEVIPAKSRARFWIQDYPGPVGSSGVAYYRNKNNPNRAIQLSFKCPTGKPFIDSGDNEVAMTMPGLGRGDCFYQTNAGDSDWYTNDISGEGHPLAVRFYIP